MAKKDIVSTMKLERFPEEITNDGVKIYGETSYENQMAVLSQYLHNGKLDVNDNREEVVSAILDFLKQKKRLIKIE